LINLGKISEIHEKELHWDSHNCPNLNPLYRFLSKNVRMWKAVWFGRKSFCLEFGNNFGIRITTLE
jgi:hypothetical protein